MNTKLSIKNFRVFDEKGITIDLSPITILTGCNSSGKSSIVKAIMLLNQFLSQIKRDIDNGDKIELTKYKIDFSKYPINTLGRFDRVVHKDSLSKEIVIEYTIYSLMLSKDVNVRLVFTSDISDDLNNGYLKNISISTDDGILYTSDKKDGNYYNLNTIMDSCLDFLYTEEIIHDYSDLEVGFYLLDCYSEEEYKKENAVITSYFRECDKVRFNDILRYVRTANAQESIVKRCGGNSLLEIIEWTKKHGSIFMIPVVEILNGIAKTEVKAFVENNLLQNKSKSYVYASNKILNDFVASESSTFGDYFRMYENQYLNKKMDHFLSTPTPRIIERKNITYIRQDYVSFCPYDSYTLGTDSFIHDENNDCIVIKGEKEETRTKEWENRPISFDMVYEIVMKWNKNYSSSKRNVYYKYYDETALTYQHPCRHVMPELIGEFFVDLIKEVICPNWCGNIEYVSSSRVQVNRLYTMDLKDDFSELLKKYFEKKRNCVNREGNNGKEYEINSFINKWIQKFEIGTSISFHTDKEGLGAQIRLHKSDEDKEGRILADEGYGITQLVSLLLQIETAILSAKGEKTNGLWGLKKIDGYDDSQFHFEVQTITIEEPEIHLHPKFQSFLADMFVEAYNKYNIHFIVETHSEYLIRKLQVLIAGKDEKSELQISNKNISILYVSSSKDIAEKGEPQVKQIEICDDGYLDNTFGEGFFDEATKWSKKLIF